MVIKNLKGVEEKHEKLERSFDFSCVNYRNDPIKAFNRNSYITLKVK